METENKLLELMAKNQEALAKILATDNHQDAYAIAKESILDYTKEDFVNDYNGIQELIYGQEFSGEELNLEELETVAGGVANNQNAVNKLIFNGLPPMDRKNLIFWFKRTKM